MLRVTPFSAYAENPLVLIESTISFKNKKNTFLRIGLLTADNKPLPYFLIQLYHYTDEPHYVINYALYPDSGVYEEIKNGLLTSSDFIIAGLRKSHEQGIEISNLGNSENYITMLFANQDKIDKLICSKIDTAMKNWISQ